LILPVEEYIYAENTTKNGKKLPKKIAKTSELVGADVIVFLPIYSRIIHKNIFSKKRWKKNTSFFYLFAAISFVTMCKTLLSSSPSFSL
jgi:hypothetical protein